MHRQHHSLGQYAMKELLQDDTGKGYKGVCLCILMVFKAVNL